MGILRFYNAWILHFTGNLLDKLKEKGVRIAFVTLHVGEATFKPVSAQNVEEHNLPGERFSIENQACSVINLARKEGKRIIAVGTTSVRLLESVADEKGALFPQTGETTLMIYPGYRFKIVDSMITNFHLPRSSLIMLVSALAGQELIKKAYTKAIGEKYRFYSYGDAMIIL